MVKKVVGFVAVVLVVGLLLASCGGGGGGGGGGSAPAAQSVWKYHDKTATDDLTATFYFYANGTWDMKYNGIISGIRIEDVYNGVCGKGTYTGDTTKDGTGTYNVTHSVEYVDGNFVLKPYSASGSWVITGNKMDLDGAIGTRVQ